MIDVDAVRAQFPSLRTGLAHFDGAGGTQTPTVVGEAIARTLTGPLSNRGRGSLPARNAEAAVTAFRAAYADLLGVPDTGIVYGRSATQLIYDFAHHLSRDWRPGDEIVVSRLDHDSNVRPWIQAAARAGATVRWLDLDPTTANLRLDAPESGDSPDARDSGDPLESRRSPDPLDSLGLLDPLDPSGSPGTVGSLDEIITARTRLVAVTGASNLLGSRPPVRRIADRAHAVGALVHVDAVHLIAHSAVDVSALGADLVVCSPYKFFGPHCGVLAADPALLESIHPDKLAPATNTVPDRFEYGTLPYEIMAGATAAVDFLASLAPAPVSTRRGQLLAAYRAIEQHEHALLDRLHTGLATLAGRLTIHSRAADRTPTTLLTFAGKRSQDADQFLAARDIIAPAGTFYAHEAVTALGLSAGALRISLAPYTTPEEIDRLLTALTEFTAQ